MLLSMKLNDWPTVGGWLLTIGTIALRSVLFAAVPLMFGAVCCYVLGGFTEKGAIELLKPGAIVAIFTTVATFAAVLIF
jgi:hypothetical protein